MPALDAPWPSHPRIRLARGCQRFGGVSNQRALSASGGPKLVIYHDGAMAGGLSLALI